MDHGIIFYFLLIFIDSYKSNKYKGKDNKIEKTERTQLPEDKDVINHREFTKRIWEIDPRSSTTESR